MAVREYLYEITSFKKDSDPIYDMGIGMDGEIKRWVNNETIYSYNEKNLLYICISENKPVYVKYLIDKGYDVNAGFTVSFNKPLRIAVELGNVEIVKILLDAGADVHSYNDIALRTAVQINNIEIVKILLDAGADVHAHTDEALRHASSNGYIEIVMLLLDADADVHAENDYALYIAKNKGYIEVVKLLQDHINKEKRTIKESITHFKEDSDPIKDMGIGKIQPLKIYNDLVLPGLKKWFEVIKDLEGKTITGNISHYQYTPTRDTTVNIYGGYNLFYAKDIKVIKAEWESLETANIIITLENGNEYIMYGAEKYTIR